MSQNTATPFSVDSGGIVLSGERSGSSAERVFLHGMGGDLHTWDLLWAALEPGMPALRYDLRGFGRSGWDGELPYDHADDLLAVLDAQQIERADLVGVSLSGGVVLNFALRHPERVLSLVLVSPAIVAWEWSEEWRNYWRRVAEVAQAGDMDQARDIWWQHPLFDSTRATAAGPALRASIDAYSGNHWLSDPHVRALPDVERLHQLTLPILLLTGEQDLPDFRLIGDVIEASSANVRRVDFPHCGHLLQLENPRGCARAMDQFWGALG